MNRFPEELMKKVTTGAAICVRGLLVESAGAGQAHEIQAEELTVLGEADPEKFPIQPKKHSLEFLREVAHLRFRTNIFGAVFVFVMPWLLRFISISMITVFIICIRR